MNKGILSIVALVFLSGCMVGPKYSRPQQATPSAYYEANSSIDTAGSVANLKWFDLYQDPALRALLDSTLRNNLDLRIAVARIDQAREFYGISKAQLYPSLGYNVSASENFSNNGSASSFSMGLGLSWELDIWGKIRHARNAALDELLASEEGMKAVKSTLVASMATAYFQLRDYDNRLSISRSTVKVRQESLELLQQRFEKGYISEWDVLQAKQLVADAQASVAAYERAVALTEHVMCTLMAATPKQLARGLQNMEQPKPPIIPAGLPSSVLEQRPDVRQAEYLYMREVEKIGVAQAMRFPSLQLTGLLGVASGDISGLLTADAMTGSIAAGLLGPVFEFNKNKRRVSAQQKAAEAAALNYTQTNIQAIQEVEDALVAIETLTKELVARDQQVDAARKVVALSQARYDSGFTSYLELLDAQRTLFQTELLASAIRQQQLSAYVELYRALGGGW
jgi:multidrug efflux system outer membrane protein